MGRVRIRLAAGAALALSVALAGCAASPKQTVLDLDTTDRKWTSRKCVAARKAVHQFDERRMTRGVVKVVGNMVAPFAGTGASLAMNAAQNDERERLNHQVRAACISDPLKGKAPPRKKPVRTARR